MLLSVNIGNTHTSAALWAGGGPVVRRIPTADLKSPRDAAAFLAGAAGGGATGAVLASVVPAKTGLLAEALQGVTGTPPLLADHRGDCGLDATPYDTANLGADRLLCCLAALEHTAPPLVVFDLGTAVTANLVDENRRFLGGAIFPGPGLELSALTTGTARLAAPGLSGPVATIGASTAACLRAGVLLGTADRISGYTSRLAAALGKAPAVVLTGGGAPAVRPHLQTPHIFVPELLHQGLRLYYKRNQGGQNHASKPQPNS